MNRDLVPLTHDQPAAPPDRLRRVLLWVCAGVLLFVGGAFAALALLPVPEEIPSRTYLAGRSVAGLDRAQVREVIADQLAAKLATPVRLLADDEVVRVVPSQAGITLDRTATEHALLDDAPESLLDRLLDRRFGKRHDVKAVLTVDESAAEKAITSRLGTFTRQVKDAVVQVPAPPEKLTAKGNASFAAVTVTATVVPAVTGRKVDPQAAVAVLRAAVQAQRGEARLAVQEVTPRISTAQASEVDQLIGTFTTAHACCAPRVTNIHRIAEIVDGKVIAPGKVFSLNQASGRRTAENGFVSAPAIADGELVDQFGGGVSQFSTTLFNAAWFAGLPILRHQPHSEYISRYPPGREATLDYESIDQTIRNDTRSPVVIRTSTTGTSVTVALYGHVGDRQVESTTGARVPRPGGGFAITVRRVVRSSGSVLRRDTLNWTYARTE